MAVNSNELKASVRLDGGAQFNKDISDVNKNLKQLDAESKKVTAEFNGQANSVEALNAKQEILVKTLDQAEKKVQLYDNRIKSLESQQKKIAESTEDYRQQLEEAQSALSHMDKGTDAYEKQARAVEKLSRQVALGEQNQERAANQIEKYRLEQTKAETAVENLNHEIDQNAGYLREAESAADGCATSINEYGRKTKEASEETKKIGSIASSAIGNMLANAATKAADVAADAAKKMVEVGAGFEASMSKVKAISGAYGAEFDQMSAKAKELGSTTKFTATEVADGFSYMSLAGWDTVQMLDAIDGVVNLAAASEMDLGEASDMVTDYLSAFGLKASDAAKMVDEMVFAQSHSNTSTKQLGDAFGNCAANMNAAGQTMETTTAILEAMANQGTKGSEAGTALAAVMRDITAKMENGAIKIGKTSVAVQDSEGNFRSLIDILADVEKATDGMGSAQKASALQSTFTARSIKAVNQVLNEGTDNIKSYQSALEGSGGAAAKTASTMMDNYKGAVTEMQSAAEGLGVALFEKVSKPLTGLVDGATAVMGAINDALTPPKKSDLQEYIEGVKERLSETQSAIEEVNGVDLAVETNIGEIEAYRDVLLRAASGERLSEIDKYKLNKAVNTLKDSIPELAEAYDAEKGSISLTREEMEKLIDSTERQIRQSAYAEALEKAYKAAADASISATEAQSAYEDASKALNEELAKWPEEAQEMIKTGADARTVFNELTEQGISLDSTLLDNADHLTELQQAQQDTAKTAKEAAQAEQDAITAAEQKAEAIKKLEKTEEEENKAAQNAVVNKNRLNKMEDKSDERTAENKKQVAKANDQATASEKRLTKATEEAAKETENYNRVQETRVSTSKLLGLAIGAIGDAAEEHKDDVTGFFEAAGDAAQKSLDEKVTKAVEAEKDALEAVRTAYENTYNSIKNTVSQKVSLWDAFNGGEDITVEKMLENLQTQSAGIKQYKQEMEAVIAAYGDELGPDLIQTLQSMGTDAANTWHHMFVTMEQDNAAQLFSDMGKEWAESLDLSDQIAKYCAGNLTAYQIAMNQLGSTTVEWTGLRDSVQDMTPELDAAITAAQEAGVKIPDGLAEGLASGELSATDAVTQLTKALQGTFQGLYEIAETSGADIPEGLSKGMEGSAEEYQAAINTLTKSLSQAGNEAGTAAAEEISTGLSDNTDSVETAAGDTAGAAADAAEGEKESFKTAGQNAGSEYAAGIRYRKTNAQDAGRQLATAAKLGADTVKPAFRTVGTNIAAALAEGIRANQSSAINAAIQMAVEAYRQAKAAIGQHSPTGIFKDELGKNIPLATAAGILENTQSAEEAAARMARSTFDAARYATMVDMMGSQAAAPAPVVSVDTSPIAAMLGSGQPSVVNYITVHGANKDNAAEIAEQLASELTQRLRA